MSRILYRLIAALARITFRSGRSKNLEIIVLRHQLTYYWVDPREELVGLVDPVHDRRAIARADMRSLTYQVIID